MKETIRLSALDTVLLSLCLLLGAAALYFYTHPVVPGPFAQPWNPSASPPVATVSIGRAVAWIIVGYASMAVLTFCKNWLEMRLTIVALRHRVRTESKSVTP